MLAADEIELHYDHHRRGRSHYYHPIVQLTSRMDCVLYCGGREETHGLLERTERTERLPSFNCYSWGIITRASFVFQGSFVWDRFCV